MSGVAQLALSSISPTWRGEHGHMAESDAVTPDGGGLHGGSGRPTAAHGQTATFLAGVGEGDAGNHGSQISVGVGGGGRSGFGSGGGGRGERSSVIGLVARAADQQCHPRSE